SPKKEALKLVYTISAMMVLLKSCIFFWYWLTAFSKVRCNKKPAASGKIIWQIKRHTISPNAGVPVSERKKPSQNGVAATPIIPERLALKIAAGMFPFANETKITEEETVDGTAAKKKNAFQY